MGEIAKSDGVKPEYVVQCMVQTYRDQQTVQECIDTCADSTHSDDRLTKRDQRTEDQRPYEQQDHGCNDRNNTGNDCHTALAAEEAEPIRKLGILKSVKAGRSDNTGNDTDKRIRNFAECQHRILIVGNGRHKRGNRTCREERGDHQPGSQSSHTAGTVIVIGHTDTDTDHKQQCHIVDQGCTRFHKEQSQQVYKAVDITALHRRRAEQITDTHQQTADRQHRNRKHQRFAKFL